MLHYLLHGRVVLVAYNGGVEPLDTLFWDESIDDYEEEYGLTCPDRVDLSALPTEVVDVPVVVLTDGVYEYTGETVRMSLPSVEALEALL